MAECSERLQAQRTHTGYQGKLHSRQAGLRGRGLHRGVHGGLLALDGRGGVRRGLGLRADAGWFRAQGSEASSGVAVMLKVF